jgi:DNA repair exonuclease SbcCD ATPase subunit
MIDVPASALDKLNQLSNVAATLGAKVVQMQQAIAAARFRLTGSFAQDCEYRDTRATLDQLIRNLPQLERQRDNAKEIYAACRAWLDELPSGTILEEATAKLDGDTLASVRQRIAALESERTTIETAKAQRTKLQQAAAPRIIKQYGKASAPVVHLDRVDTFDLASSKWFGFLCYANPELVA